MHPTVTPEMTEAQAVDSANPFTDSEQSPHYQTLSGPDGGRETRETTGRAVVRRAARRPRANLLVCTSGIIPGLVSLRGVRNRSIRGPITQAGFRAGDLVVLVSAAELRELDAHAAPLLDAAEVRPC